MKIRAPSVHFRMADLIDDILAQASDPAGETGLLRKISEYAVAVRSSAGRGNRSLVAEAEAVVRANPAEAFVFDSAGGASLTVADHTWQAGHFSGSRTERAWRSSAWKGHFG